ncbi:glycine betaine ABC transporter substrate-binding protein [Streptomyces lonarensis]|uniref:Glycine/betaine ABC transporter substrate-binding protein n=1 Tax=Streptomyces lonarensis TaxID=700599 RepID=A0A7X6CYU3_9ACTN|nr:glycine betaine ABC transporter substrate-binding protein [Streptomyces lonarensis]NJQ05073.1 glycine/betaine ABC transporter substrate-binding protein [Streptomyces lonarensis]
MGTTSVETGQRALRLPAAGTALALVVLAGCTSGTGQAAGAFPEVVIAMPAWTGGQANAAVAAHVLREELGVPVRLRELSPGQAWDQLDQGGVQVVLEDWGASPDKRRLYTAQRMSVVPAGDLGPVGRVGWYVPGGYAAANPGVLDWRNLNEYADTFASAESDGRGRLLTGGPDDASHDEALIDALDLAYTTVPAGGEEQLIEALRGADRDGGAVLANWWQPHWLHEELELAEVELPEHTAGCHREGGPDRCGYPDIPLRKYLNAVFAEHGGEAAAFLTDFSWTAEEQNEVARMIAAEGMSPEGAAARWAEKNTERIAGWLGEG